MESSWVKSRVASNTPGYMPMPRLLTVRNVRPDNFEAVETVEDRKEDAMKVIMGGNAFTLGTESLVPLGIPEPKSVFLDGVVISYMDTPPPSYYEKYVTMGVPGHIMSALELARDTHGWCCFKYMQTNCHELEWDPSKVRQSGGYTWIDVNLEGRLWPFVVIPGSELAGPVPKHVIKNLGFFMSSIGSSVECKVHCFLRFRHILNQSYYDQAHMPGARNCKYRWVLELDPIRVYVTRSCLHAEQVFETVDIKECMCTSTDVLRHLDIER